MLPSMMPRVGKGSQANVFYNTGHGHLGWTLCAVTADMVGNVVQQSLRPGVRAGSSLPQLVVQS
jgi:D-amino-acid dehydrogenase